MEENGTNALTYVHPLIPDTCIGIVFGKCRVATHLYVYSRECRGIQKKGR